MPIPKRNLEPYKRKLVQLIHVAKSKLGLDDEVYRALLRSKSGRESSKDMSIIQLEAVLDHLRGAGFAQTKKHKGKELERDPQSRKIRSLWLELHELGAIKDKSEEALGSFVKRQTGVESLRWLNGYQAATVIESLKRWIDRIPARS